MEGERSWGKRGHSPTPPSVAKRRKTTQREQNHDSQGSATVNITLSLDEYTLAWICALDVEMAAARAMLDVVHRSPPMPINDTNAYVLGSIGHHNIAVACLPMGQYGLINAAHVLTGLRYTFPKVRATFMVGVGGGAPRLDVHQKASSENVRLGDVVVGSRIMQSDLGKYVANGTFKRTAVPRLLHPWLASLVSALSGNHQTYHPEFLSIIERITERHPNLRRPSSSDDLFQSSYVHEDDKPDCLGCDCLKLVPRPGRKSNDPKVHYGAIASGNHVMRDGELRDTIAKELDVICFEMEAAGLGDTHPCLSIRGICDYADSHKNKQWQPYAAITAAAYAKELIGTIPEIQIDSIVTRSQGVHLYASHQPTQGQIALKQQRAKMMDSLHFEQIDTRRVTIRTAHAKTCGWFLDLPQYTEWLDFKRQSQHHGFLWIRGKPGAGKSTLMKFLCSKTKDKAGRGKSLTISFFFNARGHELEKTTAGMYRSILFQLLHRFPHLQSILENPDVVPVGIRNWDQCPCVNSLKELLSSAILALGNRSLTCFIDALDECNELSIMEIVRNFEDLALLACEKKIRLRICFASRHYPYIKPKLGTQLILEDQPGHTRDLCDYIESHLPPPLVEEHKKQLLKKAAGVFLWIILVVDIIEQEYNAGGFAIQTRLLELPGGLSELFRNIVRRDKANMERLRLCVLWILYAGRPLSPEEYHHALWSGLALANLADPGIPKAINATVDVTIKASVTSSSKGLAEITKGSSPSVQFIHESVRDFLLKDGGLYELWPEFGLHGESLSHDKLKQCCELYMTSGLQCQVSEGIPNNQTQLSQRLPFLEYAGKYVLVHANTAAAADGVSQDDFLTQFNLLQWIEVHNLFEKHKIRMYTPTASLFYVLADKGFPQLIRTRLKTDSFVHVVGERFKYPFFAALANGKKGAFAALLGLDSYVRNGNDIVQGVNHIKDLKKFETDTPLTWAVSGGRFEVVELLLKTKGVSVNEKDPKGRYNPVEALEKGDFELFNLLVEHGANVNTSTESWTRGLESSVKKGSESGVRYCITGGADINGAEYVPLIEASFGGHTSIVRQLLDAGADINRLKHRSTALTAASTNGHEDVVILLIERGAEIKLNVLPHGSPPLICASRGGYKGIVRLLIDNGADINTVHDRRSALSAASEHGQENVVSFLIEMGAAVDGTMSMQPPLICAIKGGHLGIARLLLDNGADINIVYNGWSALSEASQYGKGDIVSFLIEMGAAVNGTRSMQPPLICAIKGGHLGIARLLLDNGADINIVYDGRSALSTASQYGEGDIVSSLIGGGARLTNCTLIYAARGGHESVVRLLLQKGTKVNGPCHNGEMSIVEAARHGNEAVIRQLLESGAYVNARNEATGNTAVLEVTGTPGHQRPILSLLIQAGADLNIKNHRGETAIFVASRYNRGDVAQLLIDNGADLNIKNHRGDTAILVASRYNRADVAQLLIDNGADLNIANHDGDTAILVACRFNRVDVAQLLIDNGANLHHKNKFGYDAFSIPKGKGNEQVLKVLENQRTRLGEAPNE